jgi:hypothetical protein
MNKKTMAKIKNDIRSNKIIAKDYGICAATVFHIKHGPEIRLLYNAKWRAKRKNILFEITIDDINIPEYCPLLGIKLISFSGSLQKNSAQPNSPTLDRKDPIKGYTKDNVWVISHRANTMKNNSTLEEFEMLLKNWKLYL